MTGTPGVVLEAIRSRARLADDDLRKIDDFRRWLARSREPVESFDHHRLPDGSVERRMRRRSGAEIVSVITVDLWSGALLYRLARALGPEWVVEIGTGAGGSAAHLLAALRANGRGTLVSHEGAPERAALARRQLEAFGDGGWEIVVGLFEDTLGALAERVPRVDLAFVDGDHVEEPVLAQARLLSDMMPGGGVIVFDDVDWPEVDAAWRSICAWPECGWACEPLRLGRGRLGVWVKGARVPGYDGVPVRVEAAGPRALAPVWPIARRVLAAARFR